MPRTWSARTAIALHAACSERNTVEAERKLSDRRSLRRFSLTDVRTRAESIHEILHCFLPFFIQDRGCDIILDLLERPYSGRSPLIERRDVETEMGLGKFADAPTGRSQTRRHRIHRPFPRVETTQDRHRCRRSRNDGPQPQLNGAPLAYLGIGRLYRRARSLFIVLLIDVLDDMRRMDELRCVKRSLFRL